jgi:Entner-Doudoroff aldolase
MKHVSREEAVAAIRAGGIIAIARGVFDEQALGAMADVLCRAGFTALEVTLNSPAAEAHIRRLADRMGARMIIGAGTVCTAEQARFAVKAGAQFLVSPGFDPATVEQAHKEGVLHLPGVLTPTEVQRAVSHGCRMLKLFPSEVLGPAYLKALRAPFNDVDFVPTGGVSANNVAAWRQAGAVAVAAGSTLLSPDIALEQLKQRAEIIRGAWNGAAHGR